jgi:hypothetical protein
MMAQVVSIKPLTHERNIRRIVNLALERLGLAFSGRDLVFLVKGKPVVTNGRVLRVLCEELFPSPRLAYVRYPDLEALEITHEVIARGYRPKGNPF